MSGYNHRSIQTFKTNCSKSNHTQRGIDNRIHRIGNKFLVEILRFNRHGLGCEQVREIGLKTEFLVNSILSRPSVAQRFPPSSIVTSSMHRASLFLVPLKPPKRGERERERNWTMNDPSSSSFFPLAECLRNFVSRLSLFPRCPRESRRFLPFVSRTLTIPQDPRNQRKL